MDKIDTQGMSGPATPGGSDNIYPHDENGEPILPRAVIRPNRLHTPEMVKELKILINGNVYIVLKITIVLSDFNVY